MSKIVVGAVALAVVAGAGVATAKWSGGKVADELHAQTEKTLSAFPGVKIVKHSVVKGWVKSTHEITIEVGCATVPGADAPAGTATKGPVQITWRDSISHGPLPGFRSVGLAAIDSQLVLPPEVAAKVAKLLGEKPLFTVRTVVGFGGGYQADLVSPAFKHVEPENKGTLDWKGLTIVARGDLQKGIAGGGSFKLDAPGLTFDAPVPNAPPGTNLQGKLGAISITSEIQPNAGGTVWLAPSKGTGSIASFEMSAPNPATGKPLTVGLSDLLIKSDTKLENGLVSSTSSFTGKGHVDSFNIDKIELSGSLKNLHSATYEKLAGRIFGSAFSCDKGPREINEAVNAEMLASLPTLLQYNPEYAIDKLAVEIGGKRAELAYTVATRGVTAADANTPVEQLFKSKGFFSASLNVQVPLIEEVVKRIVAMQPPQEGAPADPEAAEKQKLIFMAMANSAIEQGAAQGFLVREGDVVKAAAKFEAGQLTLNGKAMPMPGGGAQ